MQAIAVNPVGDHTLEQLSSMDDGSSGDSVLEADDELEDDAAIRTMLLDTQASPPRPANRLLRVVREELHGFHLRLLLARAVLALLPTNVGGRLRALVLRLAGFQIGVGTIMAGTPRVAGARDLYRNLTIGRGCWFNVGCFFDLCGTVSIGNNVSFGHEVMVLTNSHEIGPASHRAAALHCQPVTVGDGAWLGARCLILPGVIIGAGAVVAAGSVVTRSVAPNTLVGGVPAVVIRKL